MLEYTVPIVSSILLWYKENSRKLPWRTTTNPYYIWISEVMLQQTRVETVIDYYVRFLERFPDIQSLACAQEDEVLKLWEGLGYYSRARNLHKAAMQVQNEHGGLFPSEYDRIRTLPGIGEYTAGAIASLAYNQSYPAVDGNVLRVISRIFIITEDINKQKTKTIITDIVRYMIPEGEARNFTQALFDLGAIICIPKNPRCEQCPISFWCKAYQEGMASNLPIKSKKSKQKEYDYYVGIFQNKDTYLLNKRKSKGILAGLWEFPNVIKDGASIEMQMKKKYNIKIKNSKKIGTEKHIFTHQIWNMEVLLCDLEDDRDKINSMKYYTKEEIKEITLPTAFQKIYQYIESKDS